jgi:hypothetical protein
MNQIILDAIRSKRRLSFIYSDKKRVGEPQCYGVGTRGTELLRIHQIRGGSQPEPLFDVAKMQALTLLDETFDKPGPNYTKNDSAMRIIYAQL